MAYLGAPPQWNQLLHVRTLQSTYVRILLRDINQISHRRKGQIRHSEFRPRRTQETLSTALIKSGLLCKEWFSGFSQNSPKPCGRCLAFTQDLLIPRKIPWRQNQMVFSAPQCSFCTRIHRIYRVSASSSRDIGIDDCERKWGSRYLLPLSSLFRSWFASSHLGLYPQMISLRRKSLLLFVFLSRSEA